MPVEIGIRLADTHKRTRHVDRIIRMAGVFFEKKRVEI